MCMIVLSVTFGTTQIMNSFQVMMKYCCKWKSRWSCTAELSFNWVQWCRW